MPDDVLALQSLERLLVLAAVGDRDIAGTAWAQWSALVNLDDVDGASFAVLPAVSRNLDRLEIRDARDARLSGIYRYSWTQSQLNFRDVSLVQRAMNDAGVRVVPYRGFPVAALYLGDGAAIVSDQIDVLVRARDVERAVDVLIPHGWHSTGAIPPRRVRGAYDSHVLEGPNRRRVVLRWRMFGLGCPVSVEEALIDRAQSRPVQSADLFVPERIDQLLLGCARLATIEAAERVRWTVEMCAILRSTGGDLDDGVLVERAAAADILPLFARAFDALRAAAGRELPFVRVQSLTIPRPTPHAPRPVPPSGGLLRVMRVGRNAWRMYARVCRSEATRKTPWGFLGFSAAMYRHDWKSQ